MSNKSTAPIHRLNRSMMVLLRLCRSKNVGASLRQCRSEAVVFYLRLNRRCEGVRGVSAHFAQIRRNRDFFSLDTVPPSIHRQWRSILVQCASMKQGKCICRIATDGAESPSSKSTKMGGFIRESIKGETSPDIATTSPGDRQLRLAWPGIVGENWKPRFQSQKRQ